MNDVSNLESNEVVRTKGSEYYFSTFISKKRERQDKGISSRNRELEYHHWIKHI